MKGIILTTLQEFVEENFGMEYWDSLINNLELKSQGIYTAAETYDDAEVFSIVGTVCVEKNIPVDDALELFGKFLMGKLSQKYAVFFNDINLKNFLLSIDGVIHVEVKKLYPEAILPKFRYETLSNGNLEMYYNSDRKLKHVAKGLILGAAAVFQSDITLDMEDEQDETKFTVSFA